MIDDDRIMTKHPQGKMGVHILKRRYDLIKEYLLAKIQEEEVPTYESLNDRAVSDLGGSCDGKVPWYVVSVKLDLEARRIIERVPKTSPHKIRLISNS